MTEFAAPGKAVIWGEYAVLEGAPALVMAVDRYAHTSVKQAGENWQIVSSGFVDERVATAEDLLNPSAEWAGAAAVVHAALAGLGALEIPRSARVYTDSSAFYAGVTKLGIGSSAAVCTATCAALADFLDCPFSYDSALEAHRVLQGRAGSGLDVAAACHGGLIRFEKGGSAPAVWPDGIHYGFIWVGHAASTTDHLARFTEWRASGDTRPLTDLCAASEALFTRADLDGLHHYARCLKEMDNTGHLGIYEAGHQALDELANRSQVVYKPCGAGGGDIGIALSDDEVAFQEFMSLAAEHHQTLDLEIADHGVHRIR